MTPYDPTCAYPSLWTTVTLTQHITVSLLVTLYNMETYMLSWLDRLRESVNRNDVVRGGLDQILWLCQMLSFSLSRKLTQDLLSGLLYWNNRSNSYQNDVLTTVFNQTCGNTDLVALSTPSTHQPSEPSFRTLCP